MTRQHVELEGVAETLLITVYMRAVDAASAHPVLGDPYAIDLVDRLDYDFSAFDLGRGNSPVIAARAAGLDRWTQAFLDDHPDGQVLHLGCGLDSRPLRLARPEGSRWVDVDQPEVIELRRRLYDLPPEIVTVAASVTDVDWWDAVEKDRPTLIVAEGLLMYLPGHEVHALLDRASARLSSSGTVEIVFDGVPSWLVWVSQRAEILMRSGIRFAWALDDIPWHHPGSRVVERASVVELLAAAPLATLTKTAYRLATWIPPIRNALVLERVALAGEG